MTLHFPKMHRGARPHVLKPIAPKTETQKPAAGQPSAERALPSLARMALNYSKATVKHVASGRKMRTEDEVAEIIATHCNPSPTPCVYFRPSDSRCSHKNCGCPLKRKALREVEHCPIGKW